jgi:hypothetical protein
MQIRISQIIIENVESPQKIVSHNNYYAKHRTLDILYTSPRYEHYTHTSKPSVDAQKSAFHP